MSRSRELLKSLVGPHVLFAFALGLVQALRVVGAGNLALAVAFATVAGAAAILAKRLTGNALVSACAGGIMALHPAGLVELLGPRILDVHVHDTDFRTFVGLNLFSASCGLLAAGIRLLPSRELEDAPLFGWREWAALALLVVGAIAGPAVMAMPLLILAADLAFAPAGPRTVLRRTGKHFFLHAGAVIPAWLFASPFPEQLRPLLAGRLGWIGATERPLFVFAPGIAIDAVQGSAVTVFPLLVIGAIASVAVLLFRQRVSQTLIVVAAFAIVWTTVAELPRLLHPAGPLIPNTVLIVFGFALLVASVLWRISIAVTQPRTAPIEEEPPIPSVPAMRDMIRQMRAEMRPAGAAPAAPRVESAAGLRSTVESAVAGAVAATLEQLRLAFRGPHPTEPPGTPEQVLWNRLLTQGSGGPAPEEKPGAAIARWRDFHGKSLKPRIKAGGDVLCVGTTPWPLVSAIAESARAVALVERGGRPAQMAASDLAAKKNVMVVRHDGRGLKAIGDGTADAVIALVEPTLELAGDVLALLRESRRVLRKGGVAGIGFADLALPAAQDALGRSSQPACFTNKEAIEALARLAGLGAVEVAPGALGATSIAWIRS